MLLQSELAPHMPSPTGWNIGKAAHSHNVKPFPCAALRPVAAAPQRKAVARTAAQCESTRNLKSHADQTKTEHDRACQGTFLSMADVVTLHNGHTVGVKAENMSQIP